MMSDEERKRTETKVIILGKACKEKLLSDRLTGDINYYYD